MSHPNTVTGSPPEIGWSCFFSLVLVALSRVNRYVYVYNSLGKVTQQTYIRNKARQGEVREMKMVGKRWIKGKIWPVLDETMMRVWGREQVRGGF